MRKKTNISPFFRYRLLQVIAPVCFCIFLSCEKPINLTVKPNKPLLVVEAYINNLIPTYNYVVLSTSQDYLAPTFQSTPVTNAQVYITEGSVGTDQQYHWNLASRIRLFESSNDSLPFNFKNGVYFDPRAFITPSLSLIGRVGKSYLLEININGVNYSAITQLPEPVGVDSLTIGYPFRNNSGDSLYRITNHYKDPDTLGNAQFYFWRYSENKFHFGWGALTRSRSPGTDDLVNGQTIHLTHPQGFSLTDTVNYLMASVTRDVYQFWDSYYKAKDNNGPFTTPVVLQSNIIGNNVTGCFSGYSLSNKNVIIRR
ncbi:MAG: hypothetical protein RLY16_154 [Bacteroidota bacterium]|jgi:hypothetical protein